LRHDQRISGLLGQKPQRAKVNGARGVLGAVARGDDDDLQVWLKLQIVWDGVNAILGARACAKLLVEEHGVDRVSSEDRCGLGERCGRQTRSASPRLLDRHRIAKRSRPASPSSTIKTVAPQGREFPELWEWLPAPSLPILGGAAVVHGTSLDDLMVGRAVWITTSRELAAWPPFVFIQTLLNCTKFINNSKVFLESGSFRFRKLEIFCGVIAAQPLRSEAGLIKSYWWFVARIGRNYGVGTKDA